MLDLRTRKIIIESHDAAMPGPGLPYDRWVSEMAARLEGVSEKEVRQTIASQTAAFNSTVRNQFRTHAQIVAEKLGATHDLIIEVCLDGMLNATRKEVLKTQGGEIVWADEEKQIPAVYEQRDYTAAQKYTEMLLKLQAMYPPEIRRVEVEGEVTVNHTSMTLEEIREEIQRKRERLNERLRTIDAVAAGGAGVARGGGAGGGAGRQDGDRGPLLLGHKVHEDER